MYPTSYSSYRSPRTLVPLWWTYLYTLLTITFVITKVAGCAAHRPYLLYLSLQSWTGHWINIMISQWITLSLASKLASPLSLIIKICLQSNFMYSLLRHWLATSWNDCAWPASLCSRSLNSCWTTQWITCFLSTGHHPDTVNSQKYLCNPSSDIEIKWLHRNFNETHFWSVWDDLNFHWFNGWSMTVFPFLGTSVGTEDLEGPHNTNSHGITESKFMPANAVMENVLGTLGVFLLLCCSQAGSSVIGVWFISWLGDRCGMLDCPITTTSVEELAHEVNEGVVSLVFVSEIHITIPLH